MSTYTPKAIRLKAVPEDVYKIILREQARLKEKCSCQKSQETTVYSIIRKIGKEDANMD